MVDSINNVRAGEVVQPEKQEQKQQYNISYRGNDFERTPESDCFESENKTGKTVGIIGGLLATAAVVLGGICLKKGGKALEGKDASFKEKLEAGWKELRGKGAEKAEKDAKDKAADSAKDAKTEGEKAAETTGGTESAISGNDIMENIKFAELENKYGATDEIIANDLQTYFKGLENLDKTATTEVKESLKEIKLLSDIKFVEKDGKYIMEITPSKEKIEKTVKVLLDNPEYAPTTNKTLNDMLKEEYYKQFKIEPTTLSFDCTQEGITKAAEYYDVMDAVGEKAANALQETLKSDRDTCIKIIREEMGQEEFSKLTENEIQKNIDKLIAEIPELRFGE